jgi:hypothetical protein
MNHVRHIRRMAGVLAGLAVALLGSAATPAFASQPPIGPAVPLVPPAQVNMIVTGGMPGWQITLIAVGAALLAATVAVLLDRVRTAHRKPTTAAA